MPVRIGELTTPSFGAAVTIVDAAQLQPDCWAIAEPPNRNAKLATDNTANEIDFDISEFLFGFGLADEIRLESLVPNPK